MGGLRRDPGQMHRKIARPVIARVRAAVKAEHEAERELAEIQAAAERLAAAERAQWGITRRMWEKLKRMVRRP